jgi:TrmH family RNA methyltransferase
MTKNELKYYSSLNEKKVRTSEMKFIVEGFKIIEEALLSDFICEMVAVSHQFAEKNPAILNKLVKWNITPQLVSQKEIEKICDTKSPQGIAAVFNYKISSKPNNSDEIIVALENINDPGNLGTIIRNCDWFGIRTIYLSDDTADIYNPKTIRASAGSVFHITFQQSDFYKNIASLKNEGYSILCADLEGTNLYEFEKKGNMVLVLANEANGPTKTILDLSDGTITISKKGKAESLNVASASAVLLSELSK